MAINFGEVFLREMGSAQDRSQNMAEMQLRAQQFERQLADQEARTAIAKSEFDLTMQQYQDLLTEKSELSDYLDEVRNLELRSLKAKAELEEFNLKTTREGIDRLNTVVPEDYATLYNLPSDMTYDEAESYLRMQMLGLEYQTEMARANAITTSDIASQTMQDILNNLRDPEITQENIGQLLPELSEGTFGLGTQKLASQGMKLLSETVAKGGKYSRFFNKDVAQAFGEQIEDIEYMQSTGGIPRNIAEQYIGKRISEFRPDYVNQLQILGNVLMNTEKLYNKLDLLYQAEGVGADFPLIPRPEIPEINVED